MTTLDRTWMTRLMLIIPIYSLCYPFIDTLAFDLLNGHLCLMPQWYCKIWGYLNHKSEGSVNLLFVILCFIYTRMRYRQAQGALSGLEIIFCVFFYEMGYQLINKLESFRWMQRHSPSLEYELLFNLQTVVPMAKVYAQSCFPSGHALLFGFFSELVRHTFPLHLRNKIIKICYFWCLPRLVGGAHWLSDICTGFMLGMCLWHLFEYFRTQTKLIPIMIEDSLIIENTQEQVDS